MLVATDLCIVLQRGALPDYSFVFHIVSGNIRVSFAHRPTLDTRGEVQKQEMLC